MKRSRRLEPVVKVAENHEKQAAKALGDSQTALAQTQQRLSELEHYREEYLKRFHSAGAVGMSAAQMADYRLFLANLDGAITEQERVVQRAAAVVEQHRQAWFNRRGKVKVLDSVVARYQADERRDEDRKEQNDQDDRAQHTPKTSF